MNKKLLISSTIILVVLLNYISVKLAIFLGIPFFLDTWATSLGVMTAGLWVGMVGGIIYNIIMAITDWGLSAWVWAFANIWIALTTYYFYRRGDIDIKNPVRTLKAALLIGLTSSIVTSAIAIIFFEGLPTYEGTKASWDAFYAATNSVAVASFLHHLVTDLADKAVSIFLAAIIFSSLPKKYILIKKDK